MSVASLNIPCAPRRDDGTGGAGSVLFVASAALALASAAAHASISSSFTTLGLLRLCVPKLVVVVCTNGSSAVSFGEGSGFGYRSSYFEW